MNYLLDSSALLAFYFDEPGGERVGELLADAHSDTGLSVLTASEFWSRLRAEGWARVFDDEWRQLSALVSAIAPVSLAVVIKSLELRVSATARLPHIDALIAATAAIHDAVLVHRDPHFSSIPAHLLRQELLPEKLT